MLADDDYKCVDVRELIHETSKAWLLLIDGKAVWLPKSQCRYDREATVLVPLWLVKAKGIR